MKAGATNRVFLSLLTFIFHALYHNPSTHHDDSDIVVLIDTLGPAFNVNGRSATGEVDASFWYVTWTLLKTFK